MSVDARGKFASSLVFIGWKGLKTVRQWLKPANPQSAAQGNRRTIIGGTGRAVGRICPRTGSTVTSQIAKNLITLGLIPDQQSKQSFLVQYIIDNYLSTTANYSTYLAEFTAHTAYTNFNNAATALSIVDFNLAYDTIATYNKGFGLYLIAKSVIALGFTGTPYTLNLTAWVTASVSSFISDFTNVGV